MKKDIKMFNNVKEIIYNSAKEYSKNIAFTTKIKVGEEIKYKETSYKELL